MEGGSAWQGLLVMTASDDNFSREGGIVMVVMKTPWSTVRDN